MPPFNKVRNERFLECHLVCKKSSCVKQKFAGMFQTLCLTLILLHDDDSNEEISSSRESPYEVGSCFTSFNV